MDSARGDGVRPAPADGGGSAVGACGSAVGGDGDGVEADGDGHGILAQAREVLRIEARAVADLADRLGPSFREAVRRLARTRGRVVVTGVGKSGLVARKLASTLASTGTPAFFLHPVEGVHGEVGALREVDLLLVISRSGESPELAELLAVVRRRGIPVVALTGRVDSRLGRSAEVVLDVGVSREACPEGLTPTASSTAAMAMGDALAMALLRERDFGREDFARFHPGGALGRRLHWRVADVMVGPGADLPRVGPEENLARAMHEIAHRRGTVPVVGKGGRVVGVITAGDLTRFAEGKPDFLERPVEEAMSRSPSVTSPETPAAEAVRVLESRGIMALPVVDEEERLVGIVHLHDLLRAGVA